MQLSWYWDGWTQPLILYLCHESQCTALLSLLDVYNIKKKKSKIPEAG